jgi:hypothetical protein
MSRLPSPVERFACLLGLASLVASCNALWGVGDLSYDRSAAASGAGGTSSNAAGTGGSSGGSGGAGATTGSATGGGGGATSSGGPLLFVDDQQSHFDAGDYVGAEWEGDHVGLAGVGGGRFTSRVFDAGAMVTWNTIEWTPGAPYGKPLPDGGSGESGYKNGNADMSGNILLWHFDGATGSLANNATLDDDSGANADATVDTGASLGPGVFGQALEDDLSGYVFTPVTGALNFGSSDFTWALWVRSTHSCPETNPPSGNRVYIGADESGGDQTHLWFGCTSHAPECPNADGTGRAGGTFCSRKTPTDDCQSFCGSSVINDGQWHHLALTKSGHGNATVRVFVDGQSDLATGTIDIPFDIPIDFPVGTEFAVGAFSGGSFQSRGDFDEVALWTRRLTGGEVAALYERGALSLFLQVRACALPDCSDDPVWRGPVGASTSFADVTSSAGPPGPMPIGGPVVGRYFQYAATFDTLDPARDPELYRVAIRATP